MTLVTSCDGLYFPDPPQDNVLTLTWLPADPTPPPPHTFVLFKVKSSAPKLFHVLPRYGCLLLCGERPAAAPVSAPLTICLRGPPGGGALSETGGALSENATTSRAGHAVPGQERFSVEFRCVSGEPQAYAQLAQAPAAAKSLWPLAAAGKLRAAAVMSIALTAFTENVTTDSARAGEAGVVVVPPTAKLTRPALNDYVTRRLVAQTKEGAAGTAIQHTRTAADEEAHAAHAGTERTLREGKISEPKEQTGMERGRRQEAVTDIIMRTTRPTWDERKMQLESAASKSGGIPFLFVVLAMFCIYICVMLAWRERSVGTSSSS